jgi:hypothetical protein
MKIINKLKYFFWHNALMNAFEVTLVTLSNYIWTKRRAAKKE